MSQVILDKHSRANPAVLFGDSTHRGYLFVDVTRQSTDVAVRTMDTVATPNARCETLQRFHVAAGNPFEQRG
ncbi:MAG: hypothetical protein WBV39_01015 [Rudaea sp.]